MALMDRIPNEAAAYVELERMRWADQPTCCHCDSTNVRFLVPSNGISRTTTSGGESVRRVWQCRDCRKQFSVTTGTVMHGSKVSLRVWLLVMFELVSDKNGISAREVERKYGVCPRTAWHLLHRIRAAMANGGLLPTIQGTVVADETFFGGKPKFMHKDRLAKKAAEGGDNYWGKTAVFTLIDRRTGESRSRVVPDVTGATLAKVLAEHVNMGQSTLWTDAARSYGPIGQQFASHESVNHEWGEYVRYEGGQAITSNTAENFFSQLKRSIDGTHHHVSRKHLDRYLGEFDFRYSTKHVNDGQRFARLAGQLDGIRLTYKLVSTR
jgi:transposase-like protein